MKIIRFTFFLVFGLGISLPSMADTAMPVVHSINPNPVQAGGTILISGENFSAPISVSLEGESLNASYVSSVTVSADIPSSKTNGLYLLALTVGTDVVTTTLSIVTDPVQLNNVIDFVNNPCLEFSNMSVGNTYGITIYNSSSVKVYESNTYDNKWDGTLNGNGTQRLGRGTYYFVLKTPNGVTVKKGYVSIVP